MDEPNLLTDEQMQSFIVDGYLMFEPEIPARVHGTIYARLNEIIDAEANPGNNVLRVFPRCVTF